MSIFIVHSEEYGAKPYEADRFQIDSDGDLWILTEDEDTVAFYVEGSFHHIDVVEKAEEVIDAELVPRVWWDIRDVPRGVDVVDTDGDALTWMAEHRDPDLEKYVGGRWDWANGYAPFTEVIA